MSLTRSQLHSLRNQDFTPMFGKPVRILRYEHSERIPYDDNYSWFAGFILGQNSRCIHVSFGGQFINTAIGREQIMLIMDAPDVVKDPFEY